MDYEVMEEYIETLTNDPSLIDELPDNVINTLINYLQKEIKRKEEIISKLQTTTEE